MADSDQSIVWQAIDDHREVVASIALGETPIAFRGQFKGRDGDGFAFQPHLLPEEFTAATVEVGLKATFSFGANRSAIEFEAEVHSIEKNSEAGVVARFGAPDEIKVTQRRAHFRAPANGDSVANLAVHKIPAHWVLRDRPKPSMQLRVELVDVSLGGMCLHILPHRLGPDAVAMGDRLRIGIVHKDEEAVLDGNIIYRSDAREDGSVRVGVEFRKSANSIESRRALTLLNQIIAAIQRRNIRKGLAASA